MSILKISQSLENIINKLIDDRVKNKIIADSGSNYIKYDDGTMICFGVKTITTNVTSSWGSLYASSKISGDNYPIAFTEIKSVDITIDKGPTAWIGTGETGSSLSLTKCPDYYLLSGATQPNSTFVISYTAIGRWK